DGYVLLTSDSTQPDHYELSTFSMAVGAAHNADGTSQIAIALLRNFDDGVTDTLQVMTLQHDSVNKTVTLDNGGVPFDTHQHSDTLSIATDGRTVAFMVPEQNNGDLNGDDFFGGQQAAFTN